MLSVSVCDINRAISEGPYESVYNGKNPSCSDRDNKREPTSKDKEKRQRKRSDYDRDTDRYIER